MLDLIAIGDIKLDTFIVLHEANVMCELKMPECKLCIKYGEKIPVEAFVTQIAGSAPNTAVGLAKMGLKTAVLTVMGDNGVHAQALHFLKTHKVSTTLIKTHKGLRSSAAVVLNYKGESTQLVDHVAHDYHLPASLDAKFLHISELGEKYVQVFREAEDLARKGVRLSFNPGTIQLHDGKKELFDLIAISEILFLNISEARNLLKRENDSIHSIMAGLRALGPRRVVVTDGTHGAYAFDGEELVLVPAFPGKLLEATGAGDAFATGFLGAVLKGKNHSDALRFGAVNSASVIEHVGPTLGLLSHTEIAKRLKAHPSFQTKKL